MDENASGRAVPDDAGPSSITRDGRTNYRSLFEAMVEGFYFAEAIFDEQGRCVDLLYLDENPAAVGMIGQSAKGRLMSDLAPYEQHWRDIFGHTAKTGEPQRLERFAGPDGRWYDFFVFKPAEARGNEFAVVFNDATERHDAVEALRESEERQAYLLELSDALRPLADPETIQHEAMRLLGEKLGVSRAQYYIADETGEYLSSTGGYTDGVPAAIGSFRLIEFGQYAYDGFHAGETQVVCDARVDPRISEAVLRSYETVGFLAYIGVPFVQRGRLLGTIAVHQAGPRQWTDAERMIVEQTAERAGIAVEHARADQALRESEERQAFLLKLSDAFRKAGNPAAIQQLASQLTAEHLDVGRVAYADIAHEPEITVVFGHDWPRRDMPSTEAGRFRMDDFGPFLAAELTAGRPAIVADASTEPRLTQAERQTWQAMQVVSNLSVPITKSGRFVAVIGAQDNRPRHWSHADRALLTEVGDRLWEAVERARAEAALRESEARFSQFAEASSDVLWIVDAATGQLDYLSPAFERMWGVPRETVMADLSRWADMIHPDDRARAMNALPRAQAGEPMMQEYRIVRGDGAIRYITDIGFPIFGKDGEVVRVGGIAQDLTERHQADAAMRASERRQRALIEGVPQLVWRAVDGGHWTWASPQWTQYTGQAEVDSHDWGWLDPVHPDDRERVKEIWAGAIARGEFHADYRICHVAEHRYRWFQTRAAPVLDDDGQVVEWLGTSTDVDDLRALQDRQQVLLAELQHRVRNILAILRSIISRSDDGERSTEDYVRHLQGRISALSRTQVLLTRRAGAGVDLEEMIRDELVAQTANEAQFSVDGPDIELSPKAAEVLTLAIHELATNATKYGAFSRPAGHLAVEWEIEDRNNQRWLTLSWTERGVPIVEAVPRRQGFGSELVSRRIPYELKGSGSFVLKPGGLESHIEFPLRTGDSILQTSGVE